MLTATSYGADGATFRQKFRRQGLFWFFQSLTAGYKLPGIVAASFQLYRAFAFVVFRILPVTCWLTRALSQSLAHAQQHFSASTPGQVLALRVCTLVLFIITVRVQVVCETKCWWCIDTKICWVWETKGALMILSTAHCVQKFGDSVKKCLACSLP